MTKRYIALIGVGLLTLGVIGTLFYFLLKQDNSYITYIKIQVNPSFVIGINEKENVVFYNALNSAGNKYNLSMFQGKNLKDMMDIFIQKLDNSIYDSDEMKQLNVTVMTKNNNLKKRIINLIDDGIINYKNKYKIITHEPTNDELERYSNEVVYNLNPSLKKEDLKIISRYLYENVNSYVLDKINYLKDSLTNIEEEKDNYFDDYDLLNINVSQYDVSILERSNYEVNYLKDENNEYQYSIILNLELEKQKNVEDKMIVEVYSYTYKVGEEQELITNLKNYYYTFPINQ